MTAAYEHAAGGQYSFEIELLRKIDRFGVKAVLGRDVLFFNEMLRFTVAENVLIAFQNRERSDNWAAWANENPQAAELLSKAERLCH
jgi:hypothetical protein